MLKLYFLLYLTVLSMLLNAQEYHKKIFEAYTSGNIDLWERTTVEMGKQLANDNLDLLVTKYGLVAFYIRKDNNSKAEVLLGELEEQLATAIAQKPKTASLIALRAALVGFRISLAPYKAPFIGGKSEDLLKKAIEIDANDPIALSENGNALFYRPSFFGGSKAKAIKFYEKAVKEFEKKGMDKQNWYYLNALTTLGQAYEKTEQFKLAQSTYDKAMRIAPNFKWLKEELYPLFLKKHEASQNQPD